MITSNNCFTNTNNKKKQTTFSIKPFVRKFFRNIDLFMNHEIDYLDDEIEKMRLVQELERKIERSSEKVISEKDDWTTGGWKTHQQSMYWKEEELEEYFMKDD